MGRTKNASPQKRVQAEDPAHDSPTTVDVPIGPGLYVPIQVPAPRPPKRRRILIEEDEEADEGMMDLELPPEPDEVIIDAESDTIRISVKTEKLISDKEEQWKLLMDIPLSTAIQFESNESCCPCALSTSAGATALVEHILGGKDDMSAVGSAVTDGTISVVVNQETVSIWLMKKALQVSAPEHLPVQTAKRRAAKRYQSSIHLQNALAALYPKSILSDVIKKHVASEPITAKMVYDMVDNVQLERYEASGGYEGKVVGIPGLVPKLRPYQEAAVRWMLQRENGHSSDREWELAWMVQADNYDWVPLTRKHENGEVFYCPFVGWMVASYEHAKQATQGLAPTVKGGILAESMGLGKTVEVIACMLANKYAPKTTFTTTYPREDEKKDEEAISVIPSTPTKPPRLQSIDLMKVNHHGVCICGKAHAFKDCMSFVLCQACREPLHGVCAGFQTIEEILVETTVEYPNETSRELSRLCSKERCPNCTFAERSKGLIESRATLIVTPPAILEQWEREIRRHTSVPVRDGVATPVSPLPKTTQSLKVVVYPGIRNLFRNKAGTLSPNLGRAECHMIHPQVLADADVVLMTFDSLMGDLGHSDENPYIDDAHVRLRARKKYRVVPSPLTSIKWWRVCLDEAQRVETPTATSARMALKLVAQHRWCVSGTPIGRGKLEDLYGLLLFLRLNPFSSKLWFQNCFQPGSKNVMERVQRLLQDVMWRSTKANDSVRTQMGIPLQVENKVILKFSSVEKHFYDRQLEQTMLAATDVMGKAVTRKRKSTKLELLTHQIHRLRAACCHPQVGSTGLGRFVNKKRPVLASGPHTNNSVSVSSGVLTMDQILDRLIDDAKLQCEESQRLVVMHTNAMAALSRLKVEAKQYGAEFPETDDALLWKSCQLYQESLDLTEKNASPCSIIGEATLSGCPGFRAPREVIRNGRSPIQWAIRVEAGNSDLRELWARYDFDIGKKICQIKVQSKAEVPADFEDQGWKVVCPKECTFQVSHAALGGEFVDVVSFALEKGDAAIVLGGFRTNKSKAWRLVVKSFHNFETPRSGDFGKFFIGLHVELFEPDIASDSLQRLHVLHNAAESMIFLHQLSSHEKAESIIRKPSIKYSIEEMQSECEKIEALYLGAARAVHKEIKRELSDTRESRLSREISLFAATAKASRRNINDPWDDLWWEDILSNCFLNGAPHERELLCDRVQNAMEMFSQSHVGVEYMAKNHHKGIPTFLDVGGLQTALRFRIQDFLSRVGQRAHARCMDKFEKLSDHPTEAEQLENSHCGKCHEDWNQTGPTCAHCKLESELLNLEPDGLVLCILKCVWKWVKDTKPTGRMGGARIAAHVDERAEKWFEVMQAREKEWLRAKKAWRIHMDLLNDVDEVNQCKRSMRLVREDEDLTQLTDDELNAVVIPMDIHTRMMDHGAKQAMTLGNLRRHTHTLRYLRNQDKERQEELKQKESGNKGRDTQCVLCLCPMEGERAVLSCGHSFHHTPCLERLVSRQSGQSMVSCPLRCTVKTKKDDIMIASDRRKDDGSKQTRDIKGSWGTKVTRLVCDLLDVSELGEKSIVFSQWEDMLLVVEQALIANNVGYTRAKSLKKIGDNIKQFRSEDCSVLLLNVKNGAEGLTLVEATHIFMVEPLLNCGLDSQAISRIHRIGQKSKTFVHRYLVEDTIEMKIDKLRMERQEDQLEDSINQARKKHEIEGGGIDGGFSKEELQDLLK